MADENYSFQTRPPERVRRYLADKGNRVSFSFEDVEPEEHAVAFTVAKAASVEVLGAIREEVQKALDEGRTLDRFKRDLEPRLRAFGWWGKQRMVDPETGEERLVTLGSPRRLRTIYRSNMRAARGAGQWERVQRTKDTLPFLLYLLGPSREHRVEHEAQAGTVRAADDPWWRYWLPPNGWGCKCHVRQISQREAERRGIEPPVEPAVREVRNQRTGQTRLVPRGVDPAWAGNPGLDRQANAQRFLAGVLHNADPALARTAIADVVRSTHMRRLAAAEPDRTASAGLAGAPVAVLDDALLEALGAANRTVVFSGDSAGKQRRQHPDIEPDDYLIVQRALDEGMVLGEANKLLADVQIDGDWWRAVIKRTANGQELYLVSLHRTNARRVQRTRRNGSVRVVRGAPGGS